MIFNWETPELFNDYNVQHETVYTTLVYSLPDMDHRRDIYVRNFILSQLAAL